MNLIETIVDITQQCQADQIIVCTVDDRKHTQTLGIAELEDGQTFADRAVKNHYGNEVDKVTTDNRMKQTKRVYVRV